MKKLSLDDLRVESYASQVNESELAEVKGGTGLPCVGVAVAVLTLLYTVLKDNCAVRKFLNLGNTTVRTSGGQMIKIERIDSLVEINPDGSEIRKYGVDATEVITSNQEVMQQLSNNSSC